MQIIDNKIEAIVVAVIEDGNSIRIVSSGGYTSTLKVLKPEPLSQRQVWVITGKLFGLAEFNGRSLPMVMLQMPDYPKLKMKHAVG